MVMVNNVQAIVVRPSTRAFYAVLLFRIVSAPAAREFLRDWALDAPGGQSPEPPGAGTFHVMFSWQGIERLLADRAGFDLAEGRAAFEPFFVDPKHGPGSLAMAEQLGFTGGSAPAGWWDGFASEDIDLALYATFEDEAQRTLALSAIRESARTKGLEELEVEAFPQRALTGFRPDGGRLHFGYRDGVTAPAVNWQEAPVPGGVDYREFILGYPNAVYPTPPQRPGTWQEFAKEGSFACLSWIYQDVAAFNAFLRETAASVSGLSGEAAPEEWLASRVMGRWRDGSPVAVHPDRAPPAADLDDRFDYAEDPRGERCPLTAHIRVAYGRDQPMSFPNRVRFPNGAPRLMRRGFSYGPPLAGTEDDGRDRGVVGFFFCGRVNEQFYTVLRWMQQTDFSDVFEGQPEGLKRQDALTGQRPHGATNPNLLLENADGKSVEIGLRSFIRYRGVAVLFAPSLSSIRLLAGA